MSQPEFRPLMTGDNQDDDPQVIDSLVQSEAAPPTPPVQYIGSQYLPPVRVPTRLLSNRQLIDPLWNSPTLVLPEDVRRKHIVIRAHSSTDTVTDGVVIRSDIGATLGLAMLLHDEKIELPFYTGAVYCLAVGTSPLYVDTWSVTE